MLSFQFCHPSFPACRTSGLANGWCRDFPAEIRNKIYDEAFTDPRGIYITRKFCSHGGLGIGHVSQGSALLRVKEQDHGEYRNGEWHFLNKHIEGHSIKRCEVSPNLLGTSKAIRSEGLGLLYQQPFIFINFDVLALFLEPMSATTLAHLRNITILRSRGSPMLREVTKLYPFQLLQGATGLRNLRFGTGTGTGMSLDPMNFDFDLTWRFIRVSSNSKIGDYIAKRFVVVASPFIASFIAQRGMIALLETVKFHFDCHRFTKADQAAILFAMGERIPHYLQHTRNEGLFRGLMA